MNDKPYLRHVPQQKRSLERFHAILDVADRLFAEQGYDSVTTNHIADAASVPIGSVYHFFGGKDAILQALVDRHHEQLAAVFPTDVAPPRPIPDILTEMLDNLIAFKQQDTGIDWMLSSTDTTHDLDVVVTLHTQVADWVQGMLAAQVPQLNEVDRALCAVSGLAIIKGMLPLMGAPYNLPPQTFKAEAQTALLGYLRSFLAQRGISSNL